MIPETLEEGKQRVSSDETRALWDAFEKRWRWERWIILFVVPLVIIPVFTIAIWVNSWGVIANGFLMISMVLTIYGIQGLLSGYVVERKLRAWKRTIRMWERIRGCNSDS